MSYKRGPEVSSPSFGVIIFKGLGDSQDDKKKKKLSRARARIDMQS